MEVVPIPGIQIVPLPDGNIAITLVEVAAPSAARRIARALNAFARAAERGARDEGET